MRTFALAAVLVKVPVNSHPRERGTRRDVNNVAMWQLKPPVLTTFLCKHVVSLGIKLETFCLTKMGRKPRGKGGESPPASLGLRFGVAEEQVGDVPDVRADA